MVERNYTKRWDVKLIISIDCSWKNLHAGEAQEGVYRRRQHYSFQKQYARNSHTLHTSQWEERNVECTTYIRCGEETENYNGDRSAVHFPLFHCLNLDSLNMCAFNHSLCDRPTYDSTSYRIHISLSDLDLFRITSEGIDVNELRALRRIVTSSDLSAFGHADFSKVKRRFQLGQELSGTDCMRSVSFTKRVVLHITSDYSSKLPFHRRSAGSRRWSQGRRRCYCLWPE